MAQANWAGRVRCLAANQCHYQSETFFTHKKFHVLKKKAEEAVELLEHLRIS